MESSVVEPIETVESTDAVGSFEIVRRDDASSYWELIDASDAIDSDIEFELGSSDAGIVSLHSSATWCSGSSGPASLASLSFDWELEELDRYDSDREYYRVDDEGFSYRRLHVESDGKSFDYGPNFIHHRQDVFYQRGHDYESSLQIRRFKYRYTNPPPREDEDCEDEEDEIGDLDEELVPWSVSKKIGRSRMRKLGRRVCAKMGKSKKGLHSFVKHGCVHGKHGLGVKHSF